jgi:signal transduction histidine kinase
MNRARSLAPQLLLYTVLPMTLLLLSVAFAGLRLHQGAMRQMVGERDERAIRAAAAAMEEQLRQRAAAVESLALHAAAVAPATALADVAAFQADFSGLAVFDAGGQLLAAGDPAWWRSSPTVDALAAMQPGATAQFLAPFLDPATGRTIALIAAAAGDRVAVGAFEPATPARDVIGRIVLPGDHAAAYLVAADGTLLFQAGEVGGHPPVGEAATPMHPGVSEALRGEIGTTYLQVEGDEHVVSYTPVAPVGWALVMEEAWREMSGPLLRGTELIPFVLLPALGVAVVGLWFGVRQVVRPLQRLAAHTTALGRGMFDVVDEPVGGIREIRVLQEELAAMARRLETAQQALRDYLGALTTGQEEELRRLSRELHDDTLQSFVALNQRIQLARQTATDPTTEARLAEMETMVAESMAELRRLMRALRPSYLDDLGLAPALELLARQTADSLGLPTAFRLEGEARRLSPEAELAFYRIAQEALRNVGRHARATTATVTLSFVASATILTVSDDGIGFDAGQRPAELAARGHFGLLGAAERAEAVGAQLTIQSAPGEGTTLTCILREATIDNLPNAR